ncbi:hypothetical protein GCM10020221_26760 [Streptomyces thioluteus]|uniref:Uncharacterized protein n=1 Tax=Streptomyces thioluteus TaxID=66431 RepID=A0ABP6JED8_STRTU
MYIFLENRQHERISEIVGDDAEESFVSACEAAPVGSVMRGVQRYGDTMLNELQLRRFVRELLQLPDEKKTELICRVTEMAQQAAACGGYLFFSGD